VGSIGVGIVGVGSIGADTIGSGADGGGISPGVARRLGMSAPFRRTMNTKPLYHGSGGDAGNDTKSHKYFPTLRPAGEAPL
jgi:hypothetical protein